ncbi:MAG TPA: universal stress protein [Candidatus Obscuribacterales bacterium]
MATYQKILVAIDQSPRSEAVFTAASELAKLQGAKLMLMHCLTLPRSNQDFGDRYTANLTEFMRLSQQHIDATMEATRRWLNGWAHDAEAKGVAVTWDWRIGEPGYQICTAAQDWGSDLIVVGRRGHQGLQEVLLGSVSNYVLHRAKCSVMVVQGSH